MSTIEQWRREVENRTSMNCVVFHGTEEARRLIRKHEFNYSGSKLFKFNILITTFEMVLKEPSLGKIKWQYLIIDEGHRIKSKNTRLFQELFQYHAEHKLILTGTPMQNHIGVCRSYREPSCTVNRLPSHYGVIIGTVDHASLSQSRRV